MHAPSAQPASAASSEDGAALVPRQQTEEIGRLIGESFRNMDQRIKELEGISAAHKLVLKRQKILCKLSDIIAVCERFNVSRT